MPKVAFLIPGSPNGAFFSQIAAFEAGVKSLHWTSWEPQIVVCMGGDVDGEALDAWKQQLRDIPIVLVPRSSASENPHYYAQIDGLYLWAPEGCDVYVRMDADTLLVGDIEDVLDQVAQTSSIAGVIAHFPFPRKGEMSSREAWLRAAHGLITKSLSFDHAYSLVPASDAEEDRACPFYLNDGVVFISGNIFDEFARMYLALRPRLMDRLALPYYSGQVALALAVAEMGAKTLALPMRYNFPNDQTAEARYVEELSEVRIFHYLRTESFDRQRIFQDPTSYAHFLALKLSGANKSFQQHVLRILGPQLPFNNASIQQTNQATHTELRPLLAAHVESVRAQMRTLQDAADQTTDHRRAAHLRSQARILESGLFDSEYYLVHNPDVRAAGIDPLDHYAPHGDREGRSPNRFFSPRFYRQHAQTPVPDDAISLEHYIDLGEKAGQPTSILFDPQEYVSLNADLAGVAEAPLFHFLKVGDAMGLGPLRTLDDSREAMSHLARFDDSGRWALFHLMKAKQLLIAAWGRALAFKVFKQALPLSGFDRLRRRELVGQYEYAKTHAAKCIEIAASGASFEVAPPRVVGEGIPQTHRHRGRARYVARFDDVVVRGRSRVIEAGDVAILDYEEWERLLFDVELDLDPSIFQATSTVVWTVEPEDETSTVEVAEAFMLMGPHTAAFGDWMFETLPAYIAADRSGHLPPVPILVDAHLPQSILDSLKLMLSPGVTLIEVPHYQRVRVNRLWSASTLQYAPSREIQNERFKWEYRDPDPTTFRAVVGEMVARADAIIPSRSTAKRIFLARKSEQWRRLINTERLEAIARERGFLVVYPQDMSFPEQVDLLRAATHVVAPEGSAILLMYFSLPGAKLCILNHTLVELTTAYVAVLPHVDITVLTGPLVNPDSTFPHRSDYEIDETVFVSFLDQWLH